MLRFFVQFCLALHPLIEILNRFLIRYTPSNLFTPWVISVVNTQTSYPAKPGGVHIQALPWYGDLLGLHRFNPKRYPFLLQSVTRLADSRFDILCAFPADQLCLRDSHAFDFFEQLDLWFQREYHHEALPVSLPFTGGWVIYLSYEMAQQIEPILTLPTDTRVLPLAMAVRIPAAVVVDHHEQCTWLVAERADLLMAMATDMAACSKYVAGTGTLDVLGISEAPEAQFLEGVAQIQQYIRAGEVYQVNLSRKWQVEVSSQTPYNEIYARLKQSNGAPFCALAVIDETAIISSSPERLLRVKDGWLDTRPIAGTRARSAAHDPLEDQQLSRALLLNEKERAEHVMLLDLERNDIGRVCRVGSVQVNEFMGVESHAHVHHIVSNVRGKIDGFPSPGQVFRALFPGGTITGCPKVRCMQIIAELEADYRGAYTGSIGYLDRNGNMDMNILIRTMVMQGQQLSFRTGAGIVCDSVAEYELLETRQKAKGLLMALGESSHRLVNQLQELRY